MAKKKIKKTGVKKVAPKRIFKDKISLVIPCYNEEKRIGYLSKALKQFDNSWTGAYEVIMVDDGSTDATAQLLQEQVQLEKAEAVEIVQLDKNQGKGGALQAGVAKATGDYVLTLDADMATSPMQLQQWLKSEFSDYSFPKDEILIGSREHKDSKIEGRAGRRFAGLFFNLFTQLFTPLTQSDTQCGYKLYPTTIAKDLFADLKDKGWAHDIEILYKAQQQDIPIRTMPVNWKHVDDQKINVAKDGILMFIKTFFTAQRLKFNWFIGQPIKELGKPAPEGKEHSVFRLLFAVVALFCMVWMPMQSYDYGITGDEFAQKTYGDLIVKHYETDGKYVMEKGKHKGENALTMKPNLWLYGGLFDYVAAKAYNAFPNADPYEVRHALNAFVGFLLILFTGLLAKEISGSWAIALLALLFAVLSPRIFGHSMNNPKDIPFATAFIFTMLHLMRFVKQLPKPGAKSIIMIIIGIGAATGVRIGGLLLVGFLGLFTGIAYLWRKDLRVDLVKIPKLARMAGLTIIMGIAGWYLGTIYWPYGGLDRIGNSLEALSEMSNFSTSIQMLFEGQHMWSDELPWYYIPKWILMTAPLVVLVGFIFFGLSFLKREKNRMLYITLMLIGGIFPLVYAIYKGSSLYDGMRHFLFIYPIWIALAAYGWGRITALVNFPKANLVKFVAAGGLLLLPLLWMVKNHPYETSYFNEAYGGTNAAFAEYETDYWMSSVKEMCDWIIENEPKVKAGENIVVLTANQVEPAQHYFKENAPNVKISWKRNNQRNQRDDYDYQFTYSRFKNEGYLKSGVWPPKDVVHEIKVDGISVGAITKRVEASVEKAANDSLKAGKFKAAAQLLEQEVKNNPQNELAWNDLTVAYLNLNDMPNMKRALDGALALSQSSVTPLSNLGQYYLRTNEVDKAIEAFQAAVDANYKSVGVYWPLAYALNQRGRTNEAITALEGFAVNGGNLDQAFQLGISLTPNNPAINNFFRAKQAYFKGDGQTTFNSLRAAVQANPDYKPAKDFLEALEKAQQKQK